MGRGNSAGNSVANFELLGAVAVTALCARGRFRGAAARAARLLTVSAIVVLPWGVSGASRAPWVALGGVGWGRTAGIGGAVALVLALAQAEVVEGVLDGRGPPDGLHSLDQPVLDWFVAHRSGWATALATLLAAAGGTVAMTAVTVAAVLALLWRRRWWPAGVVAVTSAGAGLLVLGFKHLYERRRPPAADQVIHYHGYALPSGHALGTTVVLGVVAAVVALGARPLAARVAAVASASVLALLVGVSRLYLAAHWLTDVVTGWLLGGAWLAVAVTVLMLPAVRDRPGYPVTERTSQTTTSSRS